jgi:hypothetical protein
MRIMAKQGINKVSTVKLPNGQQRKTGEGTLGELFRVHFSDSKLINDSCDDGQDQQNVGICERITNRGDWNLARRMIKKIYKIKKNSVVLVRSRTIPIEQSPPVSEANANFSG